jgi:CheY-like chemotaxis protein
MKKKVLFVDDERKVLEGLQRILRPMRHEFDFVFACGAEEAVGFFERESFPAIREWRPRSCKWCILFFTAPIAKSRA